MRPERARTTSTPCTLLAGVLALAALPAGCRDKPQAPPAPSAPASASAGPGTKPTPESIQSAIPTANEIADSGPKPEGGLFHDLGEKAIAPDYQMTLASVKECRSKEYYHPREGNMWLGVEVKLESTSDNELRVSPFYATLQDSAHHTYTPTFGGCHPGLDSTRLEKGDKAHGWITFELPRAAGGIRLVYDPFVVGGPHQPLTFLVVR